MRVAAIDCGTNSIRLLVADIDGLADGLVEVDRRMEIVRLGQGVDATGRLAPEAIERTRVALAGYAGLVRELSAERVRMVATSATRDAANREDFHAMVLDTLGAEPEVISGAEEAALSFTGATAGLAAPAPYLVVDIGGGSTEFVHGTAAVDASISVDIGCVRLTERHFHHDPPGPDEVAAATADIQAALADVRAAVPADFGASFRTLVGLAGSVTTVTALALGLTTYDSSRTHRAVVPYPAVAEIAADLLASTHAERAAYPVIHPGRVDVLPAGALILRTLMADLAAPAVLTSEHDILDGIALTLAKADDVSPPSHRARVRDLAQEVAERDAELPRRLAE
ncbi:MAG: exopolyphosphatase [Mycobacteriales bacterium]